MAILPRFSILGGSSPFTLEFIDRVRSLNEDVRIGPYELVLCGRNKENLEWISNYANHTLSKSGWIVKYQTDLDHALDGASIILHQNRYGGIDGRLSDEVFSRSNGIPADETLGPCGLKSAIRMMPNLFQLAKKMKSYCPNALVINLTNPLSIAVSLLHKFGVPNVIGVCELPLTTAEKIAERLLEPSQGLEWNYTGLNHRGFIYNLSVGGENILSYLIEKNPQGFNGFEISTIAHLQAIPLKYFKLVINDLSPVEERAVQLKILTSKILKELSDEPLRSPPSLRERNMDWYKSGVIPLLQAFNSDKAQMTVINKPDRQGITIESKALISKRNVELISPGIVPCEAQKWIDQFTKHERLVLTAAEDPSNQNITEALNNDPIFTKLTSKSARKSVIRCVVEKAE